jgi:ATP-binding cassette subfamily F protein 3
MFVQGFLRSVICDGRARPSAMDVTMSAFLQLLNLSFARQHKVLFRDTNLSIHDGDRIGLVGYNGSGKSSLLQIMVGREQPDAGEIRMARHLRLALVEQFVPAAITALTLRDAVLLHMPDKQRWSEAYQADALLHQLGFTTEQWATPVSGLSGGQQNLLLLARAMIHNPQLLLLDEPGNHLDIQAMSQMQQFLAETPIAWLMVAHDRALLQAVCTRTLFLRDARLYAFDLSYEQAAEQLRLQDEAAEHARCQEQREIDRLTVSAKRLATWGKVYDNEDLARKAKTMEKRIDRLEAERTFVSRGSGLRLSLASRALAANQVLYAGHLAVCAVPGQPLYTIDELILRPGGRVALLGVNGVGKSTTFSLLGDHYAQGQPQPQQIRFHPSVTLGLYDQQLADFQEPIARLAWLQQHTQRPAEALKQVMIQSGVFLYG